MADPAELFKGTLMFVIPHMDDEALACGGIIAKLPHKERIHLVYATDGMKSPAPIVPGTDSINSDLGEVRVQESVTAMRLLGVPQQNLHFFRLPEGELKDYVPRLKEALLSSIANLRPDHVFIPFRYDRHLDHLAINRVVLDALHQGIFNAQVAEYFVYYRSRLLPKRDIRKYIQPHHLIKIDIKDVSKQKRAALECFISQTTIYYPWQTRPILTDTLLDEECQNPEYFLLYNPSFPGAAVFASTVLWIRIAHRIEPVLQKWKYLTGAFIKRLVRHGA
jgi:LmbE family N-acetylglucosaminyl deacetylase